MIVYERLSLGAAVAAAVPGALRVVECNAPVAWEAAWFEGLTAHPRLLAWESRALTAADRVVVVSEALREYVVRRGVSVDRVLLLANGAQSVSVRRSPPQDLVLGHDGTFKAWQGLLEDVPALLAWARAQPRPVLVELHGDGPLRAAVGDALRRGGVGVELRGWSSATTLCEARRRWTALWSPERPALRPPLHGSFGEPAPGPYFDPLKEAEARSVGLPLLRGGRLHHLPPPTTWEAVARRVLRSLLPIAGAARARIEAALEPPSRDGACPASRVVG